VNIEIATLHGLPPSRWPISGHSAVIGRASNVDCVLEHPEISRKHCRVYEENGHWWIEDLGSKLGTIVNGGKITEPTSIEPGARISLGPVALLFCETSTSTSAVTVTPPEERQVLLHGIPTDNIPLRQLLPPNASTDDRLIFGRDKNADIFLNTPTIFRQHAQIQKGSNGYTLFDLHSRTGTLINGRRFDQHDLIIGDRIQLGHFSFLFNGRELIHLRQIASGQLVARNIEHQTGNSLILKRANFIAEPGQFIGILGPSGAGKTTLLNALSGLRPPDAGQVLVDHIDYYAHRDQLHSLFGYVPQDDIIHSELTVTAALTFAARLRLDAGTPKPELIRLVSHTIANLGLADRAFHRISNLSGGQRKRVSVGVELLSRPSLLFLDEPTSGLDPLAEFKLMELLRRLADTGCTVICTTHVMENVYLMDQIAILVNGRSVFQGTPDLARTTFNVPRLSDLYDALQNREPSALPEFQIPQATPQKTAPQTGNKPSRKPFSLPILLQRQFAIFKSDPKNFFILLSQPILIGALVSWATRDTALAQFFIYIATLWFGCNNAAQEIVRELPIYRREHLVGLNRFSYLTSKFLWMGTLTLLQSLLVYSITAIGEQGLKSTPWIELSGLLLLSFVATGVGLLISTLVKTPIQAVMLVPLILIPQILLSGFTVRTSDMAPSVLKVSQLVPSFAAERISDVSFLINHKITGQLAADFPVPYYNLNQWHRDATGNRLKIGMTFDKYDPLWISYLSLIVWILISFSGSYVLLSRQHPAAKLT
jgi:ABC transport system ATP-binding/permease protein